MKTCEERKNAVLKKAARQQNKRKKRRVKTIVTSCVCAALLVFNLILFVPYTTGGYNLSAYKNNEYYSVMAAVENLTYRKEKKNNFERCFSFGAKYGAQAPDVNLGTDAADRPTDEGEDLNDSYVENTNNQVKNVIEGDLLKRSTKYAFYLRFEDEQKAEKSDCGKYGIVGKTLYLDVYSLSGVSAQRTVRYAISQEEGVAFFGYTGLYSPELFLSADANTVTVLSSCRERETNRQYTAVVSLDVSDIENIRERGRTYLSGDYVSSRMTGDGLLLVTRFQIGYKPNFENPKEFLPMIGDSFDSLQAIPCGDIYLPDDATSANYTLICKFDERSELKDSEAFFSFGYNFYVSEEHIFMTRQTKETVTQKDSYILEYSYYTTEIFPIDYVGSKLVQKDSFKVDGTILNRYCMDEHEGVFRVFTNISPFWVTYITNGLQYRDPMRNTCNLYCVDLKDNSLLAKVEDFAHPNDTIRSARFYGDIAYVCTAVQQTDPVFQFDLSDYTNITSKDTGTVAGFSTSLTAFKDGTLLGIGVGGSSDFCVKIYIETDEGMKETANFEWEGTTYSSEFKSYYIDAERGLVAVPVRNWRYGQDNEWYGFEGYLLLEYDGRELKPLKTIALDSFSEGCRAMYADGYLYCFGDGKDAFEAFVIE